MIQFGDFRYDSESRILYRDDEEILLSPRVLAVLECLLERPGEILAKEDLLESAWEGVFVSEAALAKAVSRLREALGDDPEDSTYIQTVPRRGYRLIAEVSAPPSPLPASGAAEPWVRPRTVAATALMLLGILVVAGLVLWPTPLEDSWLGSDEPSIESLAVLPFDNLMGDPEQEYFVQGVHESLIGELSGIRPLRVISRTSMMRYRDTDKSIPEIAEELDVDAVIEGSVLRDGDRVRITAQLIDARRDEHLWTGSYDRELGDMLVILADVARAVSGEIEIQLSPELQARLATREPVDPALQEAMLRGRFVFNQFGGRETMSKALEYFDEAVRRAPEYAPAWAWKANAHVLLGQGSQDHVQRGRDAASRALELDARLSYAHSAMGWIRLWYDWDWEGAAASFQRALQLDPNDMNAHYGYSNYLTAMGRLRESLAHAREAIRIDPVAPISHLMLVSGLLKARQYDEAERAGREALRLFPEHPGLSAFYRDSLWALGRYSEWVAELQRRLPPEEAAQLKAAYENGGVEAVGEWRAERMVEMAETGDSFTSRYPVPFEGRAFHAAMALAAAGRADAALSWLERAYEERDPSLKGYELMFSAFDELRSDPRFVELLERMGLPTEPPAVVTGVPLSGDAAAAR